MKYQWKAFSLFSFDFPFYGTHTLEKQKHISSLFVEEVAETEDIVVYAKVSIWLGIYNYLGLGERKRKECLL